jgi:NADH-quinone oxidoreductase subunit H
VSALLSVVSQGDPLYAHGVTWGVLLIAAIKVLVAFGALMGAVTLMIWFERKAISDMQARIGPDRAGPWGLLQSLADGIKLFFKEDLLPERADRFAFKLAPYLSVIPALLVFTVIPVGPAVTVAGHTFDLQVANPAMGILVVLAASGIAVYGILLSGWSSGSKYPLLSSVRASAQMISYEAAIGMTVVTVVLLSGSLSTQSIVADQGWNPLHWNVLRLGVVPFVVFFIAVIAETNRPPFDVVEAESELVGGFHTEYSSIRFALFFLAEFMNTITMSAVMVTLFFGGPNGPAPHIAHLAWLFGLAWFLIKVVAFCYVFVWLRGALPRMRYDRLMDLGWKRLIPLSLAWMLLVAGFLVGAAWGFGLAGVVLVGAVVLNRSFALGAEVEEQGRQVLPPAAAKPLPPAQLRALTDGEGEPS